MTVSNAKLESLLAKLIKEKEKLEDTRALLKGYKIASEHLGELTKAYRDLRDQIKAEKEHLEEALNEDVDYVKGKEDQTLHQEQIKELAAQLRELFATLSKEDVAKYEYLIEGERQQVQIEKIVKMYVNGKEQK